MIGVQNLKKYISELILDNYDYIPVTYIKMHYMNLALIKMIVARFVGT